MRIYIYSLIEWGFSLVFLFLLLRWWWWWRRRWWWDDAILILSHSHFRSFIFHTHFVSFHSDFSWMYFRLNLLSCSWRSSLLLSNDAIVSFWRYLFLFDSLALCWVLSESFKQEISLKKTEEWFNILWGDRRSTFFVGIQWKRNRVGATNTSTSTIVIVHCHFTLRIKFNTTNQKLVAFSSCAVCSEIHAVILSQVTSNLFQLK